MQQEIVCIRKNEATIQTAKFGYYDTYEHFLQDGFNPLPKGVESIDFNKSLEFCVINGEMQNDWHNEYAEGLLLQVVELREKFEERQRQFYAAESAKEYEQMVNAMSLAEFKDARLRELSRAAAAFENNLNTEMYFTSSLGFKVNGDRRTKANLQDLITFFDLQANDGTLPYRDYDNKNRNLTKQQLQLLLVEHVANGNNLYEQKWAYQNQVSQAKTKDAVKAIKFTFEMADYSKVPLPSTLTKF